MVGLGRMGKSGVWQYWIFKFNSKSSALIALPCLSDGLLKLEVLGSSSSELSTIESSWYPLNVFLMTSACPYSHPPHVLLTSSWHVTLMTSLFLYTSSWRLADTPVTSSWRLFRAVSPAGCSASSSRTCAHSWRRASRDTGQTQLIKFYRHLNTSLFPP